MAEQQHQAQYQDGVEQLRMSDQHDQWSQKERSYGSQGTEAGAQEHQ